MDRWIDGYIDRYKYKYKYRYKDKYKDIDGRQEPPAVTRGNGWGKDIGVELLEARLAPLLLSHQISADGLDKPKARAGVGRGLLEKRQRPVHPVLVQDIASGQVAVKEVDLRSCNMHDIWMHEYMYVGV